MTVDAWRGLGPLVRLAARRDRLRLPVWTLVFAAIVAFSAKATVSLYPDVASRVIASAAVNNTPSLVALYGRIYDPASLGAVSMIKMVAFGASLVAILVITTVVRHSRADEEAGRTELLRATVVGPYAPLTAALVIGVSASVAIGGAAALGLAAAGLPAVGSAVFGAGWATTGIAFASVAAVAAQLARSARAATALAAATLGGAYLLRAIGDTATADGHWVSWLSPVAWGQQARPFAGDRWATLSLPLLFAAATTAVAFTLARRRDLGAGLIADRPGPPNAAPRLRGPLALTFRLQRGLLIGWLVGFTVLGLVFGNIASNLDGLLDSPIAREMIRLLGGTSSLTDAFIAAELSILATVTAIYGMQTVLRARSDETDGRAELALATTVTRPRWIGAYLVVTLLGVTALLAAAGLAAGLAHANNTGRAADIGRVLGAALAHLPAVAVLIGAAAAIVGWLPRHAAATGWGTLVAVVVLGQVGPVLELPRLVLDLSPFAHVPRLPGGEFAAVPLLWLALAATLLAALGVVGFRRRDLS
ncbi:ABC transporter permease [Pilimelia columellifera]|uniref:Exporter of polyketide antibiotics n=1 Tax=Pilimelia columellifera subsp. columellifera TaxID=706583 RepID=A0ABN3N2Z6_9ACTN